jgi:hypothetical protein
MQMNIFNLCIESNFLVNMLSLVRAIGSETIAI